MPKYAITNDKPTQDPKVAAMIENIVNAVKDAVVAGIDAATREIDAGNGVQNRSTPVKSGLSRYQPPKVED
jgi:hypothetical protein